MMLTPSQRAQRVSHHVLQRSTLHASVGVKLLLKQGWAGESNNNLSKVRQFGLRAVIPPPRPGKGTGPAVVLEYSVFVSLEHFRDEYFPSSSFHREG